jgi:ribosomal protein S18 acetylase RimI-like enzyme
MTSKKTHDIPMPPAETTDPPVSIRSGGSELLDSIKPLWLALRQDHIDRFPIWQKSLQQTDFAVRKSELLGKAADGLLVLLGESGGHIVAYCVCSVDRDRRGEIDSIYVAPGLQRCGVGAALMNVALSWLTEEKQAQGISVDVMAGNDVALQLYSRFGFHPRTIRLQKA